MPATRSAVVWSPEAEQDLLDVWQYLARAASLPAADSQLLDIDRVCAMLRDHPLAGRSRDELRPDLRSAVARAYVVFYRVTERLEIVRVLHGRRDLDAIFAAGSER